MRGTRIALVGSATLLFALGCSNPLQGILGGTDGTEVQITDPTAPNQVGVQMGPNGLTVQGPDGQQVQVNGLSVSATGGVTTTTTTPGGQPQTVTVTSGTGGVQVTDGSGTVSVSSGAGGVRVTDGTSSVNVGTDGSVTVKDGTRAGTVKVKGRKKQQ